MINDHNLGISEQEYRDLELPSYSMLSSISKSGIDVMQGTKNGIFSLKFGSLVDDMCFDTDKVKKKYYQSGVVKAPTINVKKIVDRVIQSIIDSESDDNTFSIVKKKKLNSYSDEAMDFSRYGGIITTAAFDNNVYQNYSNNKLMETVVSAGQQYFQDTLDSRGKVLIKPEMWNLALTTATTLATHEFSKGYFEEEDGIELFYQYKFVTEVFGMKVKGMLDILKVDHKNKIVYPVDLKTGELPVSKFPEIFLMYGYYIQAALYREAIITIVANDPDIEDYEIAPFEFLYISKENPYKPLVYIVPIEFHASAIIGFEDRYGTIHKGILDLLKEYYDCKEGKFCQYTENEYLLKGKIPFDISLIKRQI